MAGAVRGVGGDFGGRQGEDQPAMAGIDRGELEHLVEERADAVRVLGVDDRVRAGDHVLAQVDARFTPPNRAMTTPRSSS